MAGSHEVRGSIPLGSTTDTRGARRRRRAPLFCFPAHRPIGRKRVSFRGVGAGRRPFLVRPDSPAPFKRPGGKRVPAAHGHREAGALALARAAREEAAPDPFGRIEAIHDRAGTHSAAAGSRAPASAACRRRPTSGGPSPAGAARATTPPSSPPTGPRRRGSPIGGRPPASAGSAASPTHASGGAAGRGRIRRGAAWAPRSSGTRDCPREKRLAGRRESAVGSDAPSSLAISEAPSPSARRRLIYEMVDMPTISLPAPLDRLPRRRPKRPIEGNGRRLCLCGERSAVKGETFILRIPE